jgi:hypothetical protein
MILSLPKSVPVVNGILIHGKEMKKNPEDWLPISVFIFFDMLGYVFGKTATKHFTLQE